MTETVNWYVYNSDVAASSSNGLPRLSDAIPLGDQLLPIQDLSGPDAGFFKVKYFPRDVFDVGPFIRTDVGAQLVWADTLPGIPNNQTFLDNPFDAGHDGVFNVTVTLYNYGLPLLFDCVIQVIPDPPIVNYGPRLAGTAQDTVVENASGYFFPDNYYLPPEFFDPVYGTETRSGVVWSLSNVGDKNFFDINPDTGGISFKNAPDFENPSHAPVYFVQRKLEYSATYQVPSIYYEGEFETKTDTRVFNQDLTVTVTNAVEPPKLENVADSLVFSENEVNASSQPIAANATVALRENSWAGGHLSVSGWSAGHLTSLLAEDRVTILNAGTAAGQIGINGAVVTYGGVPFATFTGGIGAALTVNFNAAATTPAVQALVRSLAYANQSNAPTENRTLVVQVVDSVGHVNGQFLTVTVDAEPDAPVVTSGAGSSIAENGTGTVYEAVANSPDGTPVTWFIANGDADLFAIDANTGAVTFKASPDFEHPLDADHDNIYEITLFATAGFLFLQTWKPITVTVTDVNEAPVITSAAALSFAENGAATVYQATAQDPELTQPTWSIDGADAALFELNATTGTVIFKSPPNFEAPQDAGGNNVYDITLTASDGALSTSKDIAITVTNVNDVPVVTSAAVVSFAENGAGIAYQAAASDEDGSTVFFWKIGGPDANRFTIDQTTGAVTFASPPDYETPRDAGKDNTYNITVAATEAGPGGKTGIKQVAITVTDVPTDGTLSGLASDVTLLENTVNATPQLFASGVTYAAADTPIGGKLTVSGLLAEDRVWIQSQGSIFLAGNQVFYQGLYIGTAVGGSGAPLTVFFSTTVSSVSGVGPAVTPAAVTALIQSLTYANVSDTPTASRTLRLDVTDSHGIHGPLLLPSFAAFATDPLAGITAGLGNGPAFIDLDGDGKLDVVVGHDSHLDAWHNTGSGYTALTGSNDPFDGIAADVIRPAFADLNGDGKLDLVVGGGDGTLQAWRNTAGGFVALTGADDPFAAIDVGFVSAPTFVDLNNDGHAELVVGSSAGPLQTWLSTPAGFVELTGADNPFDGFSLSINTKPTFVDLDGDLRPDLVVGSEDGTVKAWRNTGSGFTALTGSDDPFAGISGNSPAPAFADLDGDGKPDLVLGNGNSLTSWQNTTTPVGIEVSVTAEADAANFTSPSTASFAENDTGIAYQASATADGGPITWSIGGADGALFDIDADTGAVTFKQPPDYDAPADTGVDNNYDITVIATAGGISSGKQVTISVTNVNEAPTIADWGVINGSTVHISTILYENNVNVEPRRFSRVTFRDPDGNFDGGTLTVSGLLAEDRISIFNGGLSIEPGSFGLPILVDIGFDGTIVTANGTAIGTASGGIGDDFIVTFYAAASSAAVDAVIEQLTYSTTSNAPTKFRTLTLDVVDGGGLPAAWLDPAPYENPDLPPSLLVTVLPQEDPSVITSAATATTAENSTGVVYQGSATDPDGYATLHTWSLGGTDAALFDIDPNTGEVTFKTPPDFEIPQDADGDNVYDIVLTATPDQDQVAGSKAVAITVTNVVENPALFGLSAVLSIPEDVARSAPQLFATGAVFAAGDDIFDGAHLTVSGLLAEDRVFILSEGSGAGQIGSDGSDVGYGGAVIGSVAGGIGTTLTVTLNGNANEAAVQALIRRLAYADPSLTPTLNRDLVIDVVDATGAHVNQHSVPGIGLEPLLFKGGAFATHPYFVGNPFAGFDAGYDSSPAFVDLDGDGRLDLVAGSTVFSGEGILTAWRNTTAGYVPLTGADNPFAGIVVPVGGAGVQRLAPAFVDLDGDGKLDLVLGETLAIRAWHNTGSGYTELTGNANPFKDIQSDFLNHDYYNTPAFTDVDGDGDLDLVTGQQFPGILRSYRNNGDGTYTQLTGADDPFADVNEQIADLASIPSQIIDQSAPAFVDLNNDGKLDLVLGTQNRWLKAWLNTDDGYIALDGAADPFFDSQPGGFLTLFNRPAFFDLDGDGRLDVVSGNMDGVFGVVRNVQRPTDILLTVAHNNHAPTGGVFMTVGADGATVSATNTVADADGLGVITYQWQVKGPGSTWSDLPGVTGALPVTMAHGGETLRVVARYTDGFGAAEAVASSGVAVFGTTSSNSLVGGASGDVLVSFSFGIDTLKGGAGDDWYVVNDAHAIVSEAVNAGVDTVFSSVTLTLRTNVENLTLTGTDGINGSGNTLNNILTGNSGNNTLSGGTGDDTLNGLGGDDRLNGGAGVDTMAGGGGNDAYYVDNAGDVVNEGAGGGNDIVYASVDFTLLAGTEVETLRANAGNTGLTLTGNAFSHKIYGGGGADHLNGGTGNDALYGQAGADTMTGGAGNDAYYVTDAGDVVNESAGEGADTVYTTVDFTLQAGTEVETLRANAGNTGLTLTGNAFSHKLYGGGGGDHLNGGTGNDALYGLAGADTMAGGDGDDLYYVTDAGDVVTENAGEGADAVYSSVNYTLQAGAEVETLRANAGNAGLTLTGNEFSHKLYGGTGGDHLNGGTGNDFLYGLAGADTMAGGLGNDAYYVDHAGDVVNESAGGGTDIVYTSVDYALGAGTEVETLRANAGNTGLSLTGNAFSHAILGGNGGDTLNGGGGNDSLSGGAGDDLLFGNGGTDTLNGGLGIDTYGFHTATEGKDTIVGFVSGTDLLQVSAAGFGGGLAANAAVQLVTAASAGAASGGAGGTFIFDNAGADKGTVYWDATGGSGSDAVAIALLTGVSSLQASDFKVVA